MLRRSIQCLLLSCVLPAAGFGQASDSHQIPAQAESAQILVTANASFERVLFTSLSMVRGMRLEVMNLAGDRVFDSAFREGNLLEWNLEDESGHRLPDGLYGCLVSVKNLRGRSVQRHGALWLREGQPQFGETLKSDSESAVDSATIDDFAVLEDSGPPVVQAVHDGKTGRIISGRGGVSFRTGDPFSGKDIGHMKLTEDGKLGIGVEEPAATLDVAGTIKASEGFQFSDGTVLKIEGGQPVLVSQNSTEDRGGMSGAGSQSTRVLATSGSMAAMLASGGGPVKQSGSEVGTPYYNTLYGVEAGAALTTDGIGNTFIGYQAGHASTDGDLNSFFGSQAGYSNTTGSFNSFLGMNAGWSNTTGDNNTFVGHHNGSNNTTGDSNSFFGVGSGEKNTTGVHNSFIGSGAGYANTSGSYNSSVGYWAGTLNTTEDYNNFFGAYSEGAAGISNATAIGYRAKVTRSDSLVLGGINGVNGALRDTFVGIGTTAPDRQLVVEGSQALARFSRYHDTGGEIANTYAPAFLFERGRGSSLYPQDIQENDYLGKFQFRGRVNGVMREYGALTFVAADTAQNGRLAFVDRDLTTERVSFLNTGNVGIGTSSPAERLHVVGNVKVTGSISSGVSGVEIPDYVFEPGYRMLPLEDLEKFLATEKHLPNVPPAEEIKEKGLNLTEFQMKLLEKVEELTLYTVQQAKTNREQQTAKNSEISALRQQNAALNARLSALEQALERLTQAEGKK